MSNPRTTAELAAARDRLLEQIAVGLPEIPEICAAWLAGSLGRGTGDAVSDLDLVVVVEDEAAERLCGDRQRVHAGSPPERLAIFQRFGEPANIHENHNNAPRGGSFSSVLYRDPGVIVDWSLVARSSARRAADTRLLFQRVEIPAGKMDPQPGVDFSHQDLTQAEQTAERLAFFWMMAMVAAKNIRREAAQPGSTNGELDWVMGFMGSEFAGLMGEGKSVAKAGEDPRAWLRRLMARVERMYAEKAEPRQIVEGLLAMG